MLLIRVVILRRILEMFEDIFVGVRVAAGRHGGKYKELFCFIWFLFRVLFSRCFWLRVLEAGTGLSELIFVFLRFGINLALEVCSLSSRGCCM